MSALRYRPDIDGLRAVAVLSVILYHADVAPMKGGFIGVDVFFVISGFLITSLILKDAGEGRFSLLHFWERRIRRILPALAAAVFGTVLLGWFFFLPRDFAEIGNQMFWQSFTASNFYFEDKTGYFDKLPELKPLLHTWSLAVEEQFYMLMPIAFIALWRFCRNKAGLILAFVTLVSFALSVWGVQHKPDAAFYLLPFRAWELLLGALFSFYLPVMKSGSDKARAIASFLGLGVILAASVGFNSKMPFPGAWALLPCLGAALFIWAGTGGDNFFNRILARKAPVFVGKISYSWYLWHWPLFCAGKYVLMREYGLPEKAVSFCVSLGLAYLSWRFIETPFRKAGGVFKTRRGVFIAALLTLFAMGASGLLISKLGGVPQRFSEETLSYANAADDKSPLSRACREDSYNRILKDDICQTNAESGMKPSFMLWGDSHADAIAPAFITLSHKYKNNGYIAFKHGCPPVLDLYLKKDVKAPYCREYNQAHLDFIRRHKIKRVFLVANWSSWAYNRDLYFEDRNWYAPYAKRYDNIVLAGMQRTVDVLQKEGVKVYFLLNVPCMRVDPPRALAIESIRGITESRVFYDKASYLSSRAVDMDHFVAENKTSNLIVVDPMPILCPEDKCIAVDNKHSLYFDDGHLSAYGANYVAPVIEPFFKDMD